MTAIEVAAYPRLEFHAAAVRLRLWDDAGKVAGPRTPTFHDFKPMLRRVADR
jgi:predicted HD phosphohydrolase